MSNYDFSCLNDKEFEALSVDILSAHLGQHVERFKSGKDGGVDGRFFSVNKEEVIIQCKHWLKSGLPALLKSLEKTEADKVRILNPSRYIFVTSLELSRVNKIKIKNIFSPFILSEADILGNEDINDILSNNPSVEQKHYKLWLTSTNVLKTILSAAIVGRSKFKLEEIVEESARYVVTQNHNDALDRLEKLHTIIIKGEPGIGKTSLADQLCLHYAAQDYELCCIENSLNEAEDRYDETSKQLFYFDDFLGRNFLLALGHHQDSHVVNFIRRVQGDPKKRFVLTSRSNILNQGKRLSDLFEIKHIDKNEYEILIGSLSNYDKAKILYNHIWFSDLGDEYIEGIYKEKRYKVIVKHKNFNPRLISFITDSDRLKRIAHKSYWGHIKKTLDNPHGIWSNVFDVQLDDICRHMVIAVAIHGKKMSESAFKKLFYKLKASNLNVNDERTFESTVRLLVGALLNRSITSRTKDATYDLFNPSIADYVLATYLHDVDYLEQLITCLGTTESIDNLHSLYTSSLISESECKELVETVLLKANANFDKHPVDSFMIRLLSFGSELLSPSKEVIDYIKKVADILLSNNASPLEIHACKVIDWAMSLNIIANNDARLMPRIEKYLNDVYLSDEEYLVVSKIVVLIEPDGGKLTNIFKKEFIEYYSEDITSRVIEADLLPDLYEDTFYDHYEVKNFVKESISDICIDLTNAEVESIADCCDMDDIVQANIDASTGADEQYEGAREATYDSVGSDSAIDDLFDRG